MSVLELFGLAVGTGKSPSGPAHRSVVTWNDLGKAKASQHDENAKVDRNSCGHDGEMFARPIQPLGYAAHNHFSGGFVRMPATPQNSINYSMSQWSSPCPHTPLIHQHEHPCGNTVHWQVHNGGDWTVQQPVQHMTEVFMEPNSVPRFGFPVKKGPEVIAEQPDALVEWVNNWGVCTHSPSSRSGIAQMLQASVPTTYED